MDGPLIKHSRNILRSENNVTKFEELIRSLIGPFDGQVLRPWMNDLKNPVTANVFVVGINPATAYPAKMLKRHMDALLNRNGETNHSLYEEIRNGPLAPTRKAIMRLTCALKKRGLNVLETNVFCFSTLRYEDLTDSQKSRGFKVFQAVFTAIQPKVLIVHGEPTRKKLNQRMGWNIPKPQLPPQAPFVSWQGQTAVIPQTTLSPPGEYGFNKWKKAHSENHFRSVAKVAEGIICGRMTREPGS